MKERLGTGNVMKMRKGDWADVKEWNRLTARRRGAAGFQALLGTN